MDEEATQSEGRRRRVRKYTHEQRETIASALVTKSARERLLKAAQDTCLSNALPDPWDQMTGPDNMVEPPFDPLSMLMLMEDNSELRQCIDAYAINISGFGYRIKIHPKCKNLGRRDVEGNPVADEALRQKLDAEQEYVEELFEYADYDEHSFPNLRHRTRSDLEGTGNAYWEVIRSENGKISCFRLLPPQTMRLTMLHPEIVTVEKQRVVGRDIERRTKKVFMDKQFRRFIQATIFSGGLTYGQVFFKEYGDPRVLDKQTGEYIEPKAAKKVPSELHANEIIHWKIPSSLSPYGTPRYSGAILSMLGIQAAEKINFNTFKNNMVPNMAILCSNGMVSDGSVERLKTFFSTQVSNTDSYSTVVIIEAEPFEDEEGNVKLELKPLQKEQHTDALFQQYDKNGREKIRQKFRLPPIFVGRPDDYTRATAETSRKLADEQVFDPERREEDHLFNRILMDEGILYHMFHTNTPNVTNDADLIQVMNGAERTGAMTPRIARMFLEDIASQDLPDFPASIDPDVPFSLQMAEAVKNLAKPNEPGQQVTALKILKALTEGDPLTLSPGDCGKKYRLALQLVGGNLDA